MNKLKSIWKQRQDVIIFCLIALLYSLGGGGWKFLRRYAMPFVIGRSMYRDWTDWLFLAIGISVPLHFGYTWFIDKNMAGWMIIFGMLYGLGWWPEFGKKVYIPMAILGIVFPLAVLGCHLILEPLAPGHDMWQFAELSIGAGQAVIYIVAKNRKGGEL